TRRGAAVLARTPAALVEQHRLGHGPAVVDLTDHVIVGELDVGEELLAELGVAVDVADAFDGDPGRACGHQEPRAATVLRHVPGRAGEAHPGVGVVGAAAPDLRAVEDPAVAV